MQVGDRVFLVDSGGRHEGTITGHSRRAFLVTVKWDSGMTEHISLSELTPVEPDENEVRIDGPETDKGGLIGQQPY